LRYCYTEKFDYPKCAEKLQKYLDWKKALKTTYFEPGELELLKSGAIYSYGRDKQWRPLIYVDIEKINLDKVVPEHFGNAIAYLLQIYREHAFVPGKVENYIILIDTHDKFVLSFPFDLVKVIISITSAYFSSHLHKLYILDASWSMSGGIGIIKSMLHPVTAQKIVTLSKSE